MASRSFRESMGEINDRFQCIPTVTTKIRSSYLLRTRPAKTCNPTICTPNTPLGALSYLFIKLYILRDIPASRPLLSDDIKMNIKNYDAVQAIVANTVLETRNQTPLAAYELCGSTVSLRAFPFCFSPIPALFNTIHNKKVGDNQGVSGARNWIPQRDWQTRLP